MNAKRIILILILASMALGSAAQEAGDWCLELSAGWPFDLRLGAEVALSRDLALRAELGATIFSLEGDLALTYGLGGVWYFARAGEAFDFGLFAGLPDAMLVLADEPAHMLSFGAALAGRWKFARGMDAGVRLGAGYPLFIADGVSEWGGGPIGGLWPDARLSFGLAL